MTATIPECEACRPDAQKLTGEEIARYAQALPEWRVETIDEVPQLHRAYKVRNFAEALAFTNRVGDLAETIGHHPEARDRVGPRHRQVVEPQDQGAPRARLRAGEALRLAGEGLRPDVGNRGSAKASGTFAGHARRRRSHSPR